MDLKLWEYIFEMFNYKIRQKKSIFSKLQTLTTPLMVDSVLKIFPNFKYHFRYFYTILSIVKEKSQLRKWK